MAIHQITIVYHLQRCHESTARNFSSDPRSFTLNPFVQGRIKGEKTGTLIGIIQSPDTSSSKMRHICGSQYFQLMASIMERALLQRLPEYSPCFTSRVVLFRTGNPQCQTHFSDKPVSFVSRIMPLRCSRSTHSNMNAQKLGPAISSCGKEI